MEATHYTPNALHRLASQPGVYRFYDKNKQLLYVGKAQNIKKRVSSYFSGSQTLSIKTQKMVNQIRTIEFTIVNSEYEALLLESNLIKAHQPRYNILLKDGKTYPYLCITKERFPRLLSTRNVSVARGTYYGPFTNLKTMYQVLALIKSLYTIRTCTYQLSEAAIQKKKFNVCLDYHIGNCQGPCAGLQTEAAYNQDIAHVEQILKHNLQAVKKDLKEKMYQAADALAYTEAQTYKEKLALIEKYQVKSIVINPTVGDLDVIALVTDEQAAYVSYLQVKQGAITFTQTLTSKKKLEEADNDLLALAICNFREQHNSQALEVLTNIPVSTWFEHLTLTVPKIGDKKKLVALALKNALFCKQEQAQKHHTKTHKILTTLQHDLQLKHIPVHIECFDNSNLQGSHPVAALVCFKNGQPAKSQYRRFHIKTVVGPDDFASMHEVVLRRYQAQTRAELPDLIIIDGGKGQLSAAVQALKQVGLYGHIAIIGLAKRLEAIYYPEDTDPRYLSKKSTSCQLLQRIRNEAHRFALAFHRNQRSKTFLQSQLEAIPGIGPKTVTKLLQHFKSPQQIQQASLEALAKHIGHTKAAAIQAHQDPAAES